MPVADLFKYDAFLTPEPTTFFQDNIQDFIPSWYKTRYDGYVALMQLVAPVFDELYQNGINLPDLPDIDRSPARFLQYLSENIGVLPVEDVFNDTQSVDFRRRELGKFKDSHTIRSTEYSFLRLLKYLGADQYGLFYPWRNILYLDINPLDGWSPRYEMNDVNELLEPQIYDISFMCDGTFDTDGNLVGNRVRYTLPVDVIRSKVELYWNDKFVEMGKQFPDEDLGQRSFTFDKTTDTLYTNFIPQVGDSLVVILRGDPYYKTSYRTEDAWYWRPGVTEVWADVSPILRRRALEDRRPAGTLLYYAFLLQAYVTKCFPLIPSIDYERNGYAPLPPPHELETFNIHAAKCDDPDPLFPQYLNGYGYEGVYELTGEIDFGRSRPLFADQSQLSEFQITEEA